MEESQVLAIYYLIGYIVLHLGGVFIAEFYKPKGIVSRIIENEKGEFETDI